jgi:ribose transport system substrate-binding protein
VRRPHLALPFLLLVGIATVFAAAATSGTTAKTTTPTAKQLCGSKSIKMAYVDGFGGNAWRKIVRAEFTDELSACKNVKVKYAQANGDTQRYISLINSFVAQGYDAIVTFDDAGHAALGALHNAYKAGVIVVPWNADPGGVVGHDYTDFVGLDKARSGTLLAKWISQVLKGQGSTIYVGGIPGNPSSADTLAGAKKELAKHAGIKLLSPNPVDTNWDPAQEQKVMAGLIAKYPKIGALMSDYGVASLGGIRAYQAAHKRVPPLATYSSDNEVGCTYQKIHKSDPTFQIMSLDGSTRPVRIAARKALAAVNHMKDAESSTAELFVFFDSLHGKTPPCDRSLPPDADLSAALTKAQLKALFK